MQFLHQDLCYLLACSLEQCDASICIDNLQLATILLKFCVSSTILTGRHLRPVLRLGISSPDKVVLYPARLGLGVPGSHHAGFCSSFELVDLRHGPSNRGPRASQSKALAS